MIRVELLVTLFSKIFCLRMFHAKSVNSIICLCAYGCYIESVPPPPPPSTEIVINLDLKLVMGLASLIGLL